MAIWYKTYAALKDHPKVLLFTVSIGAANEIEGLGYLHLFFSTVCAYAEDGGIEKIPIPVLEKMCRWKGAQGKFVEALEKAGFIDNTPEGRIVHEWWEVNGHQVKEHERKEKARKKRGPSADNPQPVRVTDRQTDRQTDLLSSKREGIDEALAAFVALRAAQSAYKGISYDPGDRGRRAATNLFCGPKPPTKEEQEHATGNFFASDGSFTAHHAAHHYFENFYTYLSGPLNRGRGGQRPQYAGHGSERGKGSGNDIGSKAGAPGFSGRRQGKGHGPEIN